MDREKAVRCIELMEETFSGREVYERIEGLFEQASDELSTEEKVHVIPNKVRDYLVIKFVLELMTSFPLEEGTRIVQEEAAEIVRRSREEAIDIMEKMK